MPPEGRLQRLGFSSQPTRCDCAAARLRAPERKTRETASEGQRFAERERGWIDYRIVGGGGTSDSGTRATDVVPLANGSPGRPLTGMRLVISSSTKCCVVTGT